MRTSSLPPAQSAPSLCRDFHRDGRGRLPPRRAVGASERVHATLGRPLRTSLKAFDGCFAFYILVFLTPPTSHVSLQNVTAARSTVHSERAQVFYTNSERAQVFYTSMFYFSLNQSKANANNFSAIDERARATAESANMQDEAHLLTSQTFILWAFSFSIVLCRTSDQFGQTSHPITSQISLRLKTFLPNICQVQSLLICKSECSESECSEISQSPQFLAEQFAESVSCIFCWFF